MRQHVNPLSRFFQLPLRLPCYTKLFENKDLPIHLDIGSARGGFLLAMADLSPDWNFLGLEIRHPLVLAAEKDRQDLGLRNLKFLFCNINVSLDSWLSNLPKGKLQRVSIQFPDPWFKRRHKKRRVFQPSLLFSLASSLQPESELFIQSDIIDVIHPIKILIDRSNCFNYQTASNKDNYLINNPLPIESDREKFALNNGLPVYRLLYIRNNNPSPTLLELEGIYEKIFN